MISNIGLPLKQKKLRLENKMLLTLTDKTTGNTLAVNPQHVVCLFTKTENDEELTVINMLNGNLVVSESYIDVFGQLQGQLK